MSLSSLLAGMPLNQRERMLLAFVKPLGIFLTALLVLLLIRRLVRQYLLRRSFGPNTGLGILREAIHGPSLLWCLAAAIAIALRNSNLTEKQDAIAEKIIVSFLILSITLVAGAVITRLIAGYGEKRGLPFAVAGLSRTLIQIVVLLLGLSSLLGVWDFNITPLLTALGVGGLAVALALQDTLANFFAGIHILVENPISVGEAIKLSSGEEGTVSDIGWRTTRVRTANNNTIVIPNTKITTGILTNYSLPNQRVMGDVVILTSLDADPGNVRRIALKVAAETPGVLPDPAPSFAFDPGVTANNLQSKLTFWSENRGVLGGAQSELRLRLLDRFRAEGVPLPVPERIVVGRN